MNKTWAEHWQNMGRKSAEQESVTEIMVQQVLAGFASRTRREKAQKAGVIATQGSGPIFCMGFTVHG